MPTDLIALVPLLPLFAAVMIALFATPGRRRGDYAERVTARSALAAVTLSLALLAMLGVGALLHQPFEPVNFGTWFAAGDIEIRLSFVLDGLGLTAALVVAVIGWLTLLFSARYMHREAGFHRFFAVMCLFIAAMLFIVLAGNAVLMFIGWELAGLASYLLIGYAHERATATRNAVRAFVTNRIGDAGFLLGLAIAYRYLGNTEWATVATGAGTIGNLAVGVVVFGFVVAALAKSAQLPFSPWIARALEGPTPSSAIFYGALMIHAGVYLCLRLEPLLAHSPVIMGLLATIGLLTALYGWFVGLVQCDVKSALIFGTLAQVGLMFLWIGLGAFDLAAWHLGLHAVFRAYQFLAAPSYLHHTGTRARPVPHWLGRSEALYTAALERLWVEAFTDATVARPAQALAAELRSFDEQVVSRLAGTPAELHAPEDETAPQGAREIVRGHGLAGALLEWIAPRLYRVEQRLLLTGGAGVQRVFRTLGGYLEVVERLLERPRYLMLIILIALAAAL
ncbi:MAG: proton-conducting transporter membrane subunit [Gammaproteobacteria bacterium]|nr:proton-conducting transporter membrane subunit [Gammaproteobacteria bacterium]MDH5512421.1 proton-conducting transporter membrane subunit [Gammaproteobacteria bacterium]